MTEGSCAPGSVSVADSKSPAQIELLRAFDQVGDTGRGGHGTAGGTMRTALPHDHRSLMSYFPTGVTVVATLDGEGIPHGITCSSLTSVCLEPPTVLVSIRTGSLTLLHALQQGVFGVTLLDVESREVAQRFAAPARDRFAGLSWIPSPLGTPWIVQSMTAAADCDVCQTMEVGDHTLLFGRIRNVRVRGGTPLLYGLRDYHRWPGRDTRGAAVESTLPRAPEWSADFVPG